MLTSNSVRRLLASITVLAGVAFAAGRAHASEEFPGALQQAAGMPCTPSCTVCHGKTPGDAGSFTARALPTALIMQGVTPAPHDVNFLKTAYAKYAMDPANAATVTALKAGVDPQTGDSLCGPTYGCGAHVAKKTPPTDFSAPLWVVGAMLTAGILRRRRKPSAG